MCNLSEIARINFGGQMDSVITKSVQGKRRIMIHSLIDSKV